MNRNATSNRKPLAIGPKAHELTEAELDAVSGGDTKVMTQTVDVTQNQQRTAIKAAEAADSYIRR
jgi:hypothetical protein